MSDTLANFSCLDELIQVVYQSIYKFVVFSTLSDDKWNIHVGLSGREGRWWHGFWTEEDIHRIFGSKSSDKLLESFAEKLAEAFMLGEIFISDWSPEKGANIKFTLGPTSKKPMHVPLIEMASEEAAAHATSIFVDIALQAQSRRCRLYPSSMEYQATSSYTPLPRTTEQADVPAKRKLLDPPLDEAGASTEHQAKATPSATSILIKKAAAAEEEIKALKSQLKNPRRTGSPVEKPTLSVARPHKGASLANPNKKARKYQAIEFESDDE